MRRRQVLGFATLSALAAPCAFAQQPDVLLTQVTMLSAKSGFVNHFDWDRVPSSDQLKQAFLSAPTPEPSDLFANVRCRAFAHGEPRRCDIDVIEPDTPAGRTAALKLASDFNTRDPRAGDANWVYIAMRLYLADGSGAGAMHGCPPPLCVAVPPPPPMPK